MSKFHKMSVLAAIVTAGAFASQAHAAPITLVGTLPDAFMDQGFISYSATTKTLTVTGNTEYVTGPTSVKTNDSNGVFSLTAKLSTVSGSGSTEVFNIVSGSLTETGKPTTDPTVTHTFFSSNNLLQFGYNTNTDNFQFIFGSATGDDVTAGKNVAVSLHGNGSTNFTTSFFDANFANNQIVPIGTADTFAAPEPASLSLIALAVPLMLRRRRQA